MLETVNDFGRKVTALFVPGKYCTFAPPEETLGVIDTSDTRDGSRGMAFLCDEIRTNFGGQIMRIGYRQICCVRIIRSFETTFDDELEIEAPNCCIRVTDCSLNKFFLKQMINSLGRIYYTMTEDALTKLREQCTADAMAYFSGSIPAVEVTVPASDVSVAVAQPQPAAVPIEIPEGKINWLSEEPSRADKSAAADEALVDALLEDELLDAASDIPEDMSREETMAFLLDSINEINAEPCDDELAAEEHESAQPENNEDDAPMAEQSCAIEQTEAAPNGARLSIEPQSDDVYIKASRRLRLFCEENSIGMDDIELEVKENMVAAAEMYSAMTADNDIPGNIAERAEKLRLATDRLTDYFALGEDIAARVMFFMLYQMLSYSDRIAQTDETKERLNDFFRRFGGVGMALSLLDSGI
ncbi:MAG: hypothetical protein ACI4KA_07725 [Oscillospiraceae bacterium]